MIAGTTWLWAREGMANSVDVLFVDEAGQKSLADVLAVSGATTQLVLLGDPQQLAQPSKGSHPEGAEVSALEHVLGGEPTMPARSRLVPGVDVPDAPDGLRVHLRGRVRRTAARRAGRGTRTPGGRRLRRAAVRAGGARREPELVERKKYR